MAAYLASQHLTAFRKKKPKIAIAIATAATIGATVVAAFGVVVVCIVHSQTVVTVSYSVAPLLTRRPWKIAALRFRRATWRILEFQG